MYQAIVCRVKTRPHPNADRLQLGTVSGHQVVVGLNTEDESLGVFFPSDGQITPSFLVANNLFPVLDDNGKKVGGGFFDKKNRRVRAQSFRGEKSDGFWCPLDYLFNWIDHHYMENDIDQAAYNSHYKILESLKEGDTFDKIGEMPLCNKYYTPKTLRAMANVQAHQRKENKQFAQHLDTKQFRYEADMIPEGSVVYISEKLHGTSGRFGRVQEEVESPKGFFGMILFILTWCIAKFNRFVPEKEYVNLVGTRRTIQNSPDDPGFYGDSAFRHKVGYYLSDFLKPGEIIYGEHVGWVNDTTPIMGRHNPAKVSKNYAKQYGEEIVYSYGELQGESQFYPYRVTRVAPDGSVVELSEPQMRARATSLGFNLCPLLAGPYVIQKLDSEHTPFIMDGTDFIPLADKVDSLVDGSSTLDSRHPREGVVIRVETPTGETYFLKDKSHPFKVMEGIAKDSGEVDMEEAM